MAKVTTVSDIKAISGRLCKTDPTCYAVNKHTGVIVRYDFHGSNQPNTTAQQNNKANFKTRTKAAANWWNANKPLKDTEGRELGTALYQTLKEMWQSDKEHGSVYVMFLSLIDEDLKVTIGTTTIQLSATDAGTIVSSDDDSDDDDNQGDDKGGTETPEISD